MKFVGRSKTIKGKGNGEMGKYSSERKCGVIRLRATRLRRDKSAYALRGSGVTWESESEGEEWEAKKAKTIIHIHLVSAPHFVYILDRINKIYSNQRAGRGWRRTNHGFLRWARMIPSSWD